MRKQGPKWHGPKEYIMHNEKGSIDFVDLGNSVCRKPKESIEPTDFNRRDVCERKQKREERQLLSPHPSTRHQNDYSIHLKE
mmetsp:Transcript_749/g.1583  ORF Transcript_749/g.1583 Transcript_749/m.1583 type:complete len:82 (-) Transcript_749:116-361(-)